MKKLGIYEDWKKEVNEKLGKAFDKEKIPAVIKRCLKCLNLSLEFDPRTGRVHCTKCGFEEHIKTVK